VFRLYVASQREALLGRARCFGLLSFVCIGLGFRKGILVMVELLFSRKIERIGYNTRRNSLPAPQRRPTSRQRGENFCLSSERKLNRTSYCYRFRAISSMPIHFLRRNVTFFSNAICNSGLPETTWSVSTVSSNLPSIGLIDENALLKAAHHCRLDSGQAPVLF